MDPLITSPAEIRSAVDSARSSGEIALDTEFVRERTYRARLCLVQLATRDTVWLIDAASVDPSLVGELVSDRDVEIVVHAGKQDLQIFHDAYGVIPRRVFDVQIAAGFAGLGGSLPYGRLVSQLLGIELAKGESYTDWCTRPLTPAQLTYAADDVRYLLPAADALKARLVQLERMAWVEEEMEALQSQASYASDPEEAWRRVSGRGSLSPRQLAILKEVARWREEAAMSRDVPRGWVVKDVTLVDIARRAPASIDELKRLRGLNPKEAERSGRAILEAVARGKRGEPIVGKRSPSRGLQQRVRALAGVAEAILKARSDQAGVATEFVATRDELEAVLSDVLAGSTDGSRHPLLGGWRRDLAGRSILALAEGQIAIAASDRPPFVREIELKR